MNQLLPIIRRKRRPLVTVETPRSEDGRLKMEDGKTARAENIQLPTSNAELPKTLNGTDATDATDGGRKISREKTSITR